MFKVIGFGVLKSYNEKIVFGFKSMINEKRLNIYYFWFDSYWEYSFVVGVFLYLFLDGI